MRKKRFGVGICVHNEQDYIEYCLKAMYDFAEVISVSINTGKPWGGNAEPLDKTLEIVKAFKDPLNKICIQTGEWTNEIDQRNSNLDAIRDKIDYYMIVDADEIYDFVSLRNIYNYVWLRPFVGQFRIRMNTYWKISPVYKIDPPEPLKNYFISKVRPTTKFVGLRGTNEKWKATIPRMIAIYHHFSYARKSEQIAQKLRNFSHRDEIVPNWYKNVWEKWDNNKEMENLHPTHPEEYKRAITVNKSELPKVMCDHPFVR